MTHVGWRLPGALLVVASVLLAVAVRSFGDCSALGSERREVAIAALLIGSGAAYAVGVTLAVLETFMRPAVASVAGLLTAVAFGALFSVYALATDLGDCPS